MEKACNENKSETKIRMKRAERNLKKFFEEIKNILDKQPDDIVMANSSKTVEHAQTAEQMGSYFSHIYSVFYDATGETGMSKKVNK